MVGFEVSYLNWISINKFGDVLWICDEVLELNFLQYIGYWSIHSIRIIIVSIH